MLPGTMALARNNRRYMERVVGYLARDCGIRQFIDNGSGLPTSNNVHHIAQAINSGSRVIYIDNDPVVLRHQRVSALAENEHTAELRPVPQEARSPPVLRRPGGGRTWPGQHQRLAS